ncbi:MAG: diacylglycerol/lipid kinase family protein, partial [Gemmatimonadota bacterium]
MGAKAVRVLYNPASGSGRGARAIVGIRAAFARCGFTDVRATRHAGDEARLVAEAIADGGVTERRVDMGRVDDIWFLNVAGMGFDVACNAAAERLRPLPGAPRYVAAALSELFRYEGLPIGVDGAPMRRRL